MTGQKTDIGALVVGTTYGVLTHARAIDRAGMTVLGLVGRDGAKARHRADRMGIPHAFTDLDEALALPGVDLVAVTTPPHTHAAISIAACEAGKHVLCEKPFALNVDEARDVLAAARQSGGVHMLGTEYRFTTAQATLQRVIASGVIGEPRLAIFTQHLWSLVDPKVVLPSWWESEEQGGGWLGAAGSHVIDQIRYTLGEFESLSASLDRMSPRPNMTADDTYSIQFRLAGGCTGVLQGTCAALGPNVATTKVVGTLGSAWLDGTRWREETVYVDTGSGPQAIPPAEDLPLVDPIPPEAEFLPEYAETTKWHSNGADLAPFTRLYERMAGLIRGEDVPSDPPAATFEDGVAVQAVLDAIRRSSAKRAWVDVERV